jgi:hypothetical protein
MEKKKKRGERWRRRAKGREWGSERGRNGREEKKEWGQLGSLLL